MGPNEFLTDAEELVIVNYIISAQGRQLPVTKYTIMSLVSSLLSDKQNFLEINHDRRFKCRNWRPSGPEEQWYKLFLKRHPTIDVRMKEYFSSSRRNVNQQDIKQWYAYIYSYLVENDLLEILHEAKRNFNINEAIFEFSPKESNLLAEKSSKIDNEFNGLTVLVNIGANGSLLPPLIIYPKKAAIGKIDSCQINNDILYKYLCNSFDEWLTYNNIQRPVIVWVDKHESRMQYNLVKILTELQIIIILIPPNTSHFMQPIDVEILTQMKKVWVKRVNDFRALNPNKCITKENFARIFLPMYANVISQDKIKAAFRKCGIHPFDVKAPDYSKLTQKATHSSYTTVLGEMEQNGMIERKTQITPVLKLYASSQTWFPQSSEVSSRNKVAMTAFGARREIISKGCDDAVSYSPRNHLTNESKPTSSSTVSDSTTKDELRRTSKEKLYPFLKECFVSVKRLPKKFTATDVPKYVDTEKVPKLNQTRNHGGEKKENLPNKCLICDYSCLLKQELSKHIKLKHAVHQCSSCDFRCSYKNALNFHIKTFHMQPYNCPYCDFECVIKNKLQIHINKVHPKSISCLYCDFACKTKAKLYQHVMRYHKNVKSFKCKYCDYASVLYSYLLRHERVVHKKYNLYKCPVCFHVARTKIGLIRHTKLNHKKQEPIEAVKQEPIEICMHKKQEQIEMVKQEPIEICMPSWTNQDQMSGLNQEIKIDTEFFGETEDTELLESSRLNQIEFEDINLKEKELESNMDCVNT